MKIVANIVDRDVDIPLYIIISYVDGVVVKFPLSLATSPRHVVALYARLASRVVMFKASNNSHQRCGRVSRNVRDFEPYRLRSLCRVSVARIISTGFDFLRLPFRLYALNYFKLIRLPSTSLHTDNIKQFRSEGLVLVCFTLNEIEMWPR